MVEESATVDVEASSARLTARVNPEGVGGTRCRVEYGTSTGYGSSAACEPSETLSGSAGIPVSLQLESLVAGTTYHWRVVLSDEHDASILGTDNSFVYVEKSIPPAVQGDCPNETLRVESDPDPATGTAFSSELPDCRAYEMVTPVRKNGALFSQFLFNPAAQVSAEGSRVVTLSDQCFDEAPSCTGKREELGVPFMFSRGEDGWSTQVLAPSAGVLEDSGAWGASAQSAMALFNAPVNGQASDSFFAVNAGEGPEAVGPLSETRTWEEIHSGAQSVATADLSHIVFWDEVAEGLWPSLLGHGLALYEYAGRNQEKPFLVDVEGGEHSTKVLGKCSTLAELPVEGAALETSLSADGSVVYFNVCPGGETGGAVGGALYARVDGEGPGARTVAVSVRGQGSGSGAGECAGVCASSPASGARLEGVAEDGEDAFFSSTQRLTNDASEDEGQNALRGCTSVRGVNGCNLYMFEGLAGGGRVVDVSAGDVSGDGPEVQGVVASLGGWLACVFRGEGRARGREQRRQRPRGRPGQPVCVRA